MSPISDKKSLVMEITTIGAICLLPILACFLIHSALTAERVYTIAVNPISKYKIIVGKDYDFLYRDRNDQSLRRIESKVLACNAGASTVDIKLSFWHWFCVPNTITFDAVPDGVAEERQWRLNE